ncbi:MAG TPA: hypothetical protein VGW78_04150, partial [Candidatus Babeliales bacterium]|nr:hypothetical protein [Candidatus Babeliales bacterium]
YAQEAAKTYQETAPKQPSWYARNIQPYIESWKQRTAPALEQYQPHTAEEGYEVAMKPEYAEYRQKVPSTWLGKRLTSIQNIPEKLATLYKIRKYYDNVEEYLATHPSPHVQQLYQQILNDYRNNKISFKSFQSMINDLAIKMDKEYEDLTKSFSNKFQNTPDADRVNDMISYMDSQVKSGKESYGAIQHRKLLNLADLFDMTHRSASENIKSKSLEE